MTAPTCYGDKQTHKRIIELHVYIVVWALHRRVARAAKLSRRPLARTHLNQGAQAQSSKEPPDLGQGLQRDAAQPISTTWPEASPAIARAPMPTVFTTPACYIVHAQASGARECSCTPESTRVLTSTKADDMRVTQADTSIHTQQQ